MPRRYALLPRLVAACCVLLGCAACERAPSPSAPSAPSDSAATSAAAGWPIVAGVDECAQCSMIVQKARCGALIVTERAGARTRLVFDDLGCYFDYLFEHADDTAVADGSALVADYESGVSIPAAQAMYVAADPGRLGTPMNSGLAAVGTREAAARLAKDTGGDVLDAPGAATWRRAFMEKRYGNPNEPKPGK